MRTNLRQFPPDSSEIDIDRGWRRRLRVGSEPMPAIKVGQLI